MITDYCSSFFIRKEIKLVCYYLLIIIDAKLYLFTFFIMSRDMWKAVYLEGCTVKKKYSFRNQLPKVKLNFSPS